MRAAFRLFAEKRNMSDRLLNFRLFHKKAQKDPGIWLKH